MSNYIKPLKDKSGVLTPLYTGDGKNSASSPMSFTIYDTIGAIVDISGWTIKLVCVDSVESDAATVFAALSGSIAVGTDGIVTFDITGVDITNTYEDAILTIYKVVSSDNSPLAQFFVDVIEAATG